MTGTGSSGLEGGAGLARAVADAADAWLTDPRDARAYARVVDAVEGWRAFRRPALPGTEPAAQWSAQAALFSSTEVPTEPDEGSGPAGSVDADSGSAGAGEAGADEPAGPGRVESIGSLLGGDPRQVLDRLRRGAR